MSHLLSATLVEVRRMDHTDLAWSSKLHEQALDGGLFPRLGPGFLMGYHRGFLASPHGVALVLEIDGRPRGFLLGSTDEARHRRHLVKAQWRRLATAGAAAMLVRPDVLWLFLRTRLRRYVRSLWRMRAGPGLGRSGAGTEPWAVLAHVAVELPARGFGGGQCLVEAFESMAWDANCARARVSTHGAAEFYRRVGWEPVTTTQDLDGLAHVVLERHRDGPREPRVGSAEP